MKKSHGFTIVEIMIVIAMLVLTVSVAVFIFSSFRKNNALNIGQEKIVNLLKIARSNTIASKEGDVYGVHLTQTTATLFKGRVYADLDPNNSTYTLSGFIEISNIDLVGGGNDIIFDKLTGETSQSGTTTIRLISDTTETKDIFIRKTGLSEF